jgi:co-chaperonin GroES (HSP10)
VGSAVTGVKVGDRVVFPTFNVLSNVPVSDSDPVVKTFVVNQADVLAFA